MKSFERNIEDQIVEPAGVRVKALEWNPYRAETPWGHYHIDNQTDRPVDELKGRPPFLLSGTRLDLARFDTLEAAKSAAQADFASRILSCIEAEPVGWRDVLRRARDMLGRSGDGPYIEIENAVGNPIIGFIEVEMDALYALANQGGGK